MLGVGPVGRHALWLIVLVKLLTPPLVVWPWAVRAPLGVAGLDARAAPAPVAPAAVVPPPSNVAEPTATALPEPVAGEVEYVGADYGPASDGVAAAPAPPSIPPA